MVSGSSIRLAAIHVIGMQQQNELIEFLKSLQALPAGSSSLVVDEHGSPRAFPSGENTSKETHDRENHDR